MTFSQNLKYIMPKFHTHKLQEIVLLWHICSLSAFVTMCQ